jgi:hypothetical protein
MQPPASDSGFECVVDYDPDVPCVVMTWDGHARGAPFREANERVLAALVEQRADRLLGDIERLRMGGAEDRIWLGRDWMPRAVDAGLRFAALVTPAFDLEHAPVRLVGETLPSELSLAYFDDREEARAWLKSR